MTITYEESLERKVHKLRELSRRRADAAAKYRTMEHARKRILAMAMKTAEVHGVGSVTAQDREAHASTEYGAWLDGYEEACRAWYSVDMEWQIEMLKSELWRTVRADRRAEMKELGG